jgi:hypothetical protein
MDWIECRCRGSYRRATRARPGMVERCNQGSCGRSPRRASHGASVPYGALVDALRNTDQQHAKIRTMLREMVSLPQGGSSEFGLAAAGSGAKAVVRLQRRLSFSPIPEAANSATLLDDGDLR